MKDLQAKNMPRLVIPYKHIVIEGKIDGPRNLSHEHTPRERCYIDQGQRSAGDDGHGANYRHQGFLRGIVQGFPFEG